MSDAGGSAVFEVITEDLVESRRVAGVLVSCDLVRRGSSDRHGRAEEGFGGFLIAGLAQVGGTTRTVRSCTTQKNHQAT